MFVPLSHPPGHAQCDFGESLVAIGRVEQKAHCFVLDLPHSDGCFVKAYPAETTEDFLNGHVYAFAFLGSIPVGGRIVRQGLYRRFGHRYSPVSRIWAHSRGEMWARSSGSTVSPPCFRCLTT